MIRVARAGAVMLAVLAAACGPYPQIAQKLDVTTPFEHADTWISAQGATDVRVLVLGSPGQGEAGFTVTTLQTPVSAGTSMSALQGDWTEDASSGTATFRSHQQYVLADERSKPILARVGATRHEVDLSTRVGFVRSPGQLVVTGDPDLSGTYVRLAEALARLGTTAERDAACAFQIVNLAIRATHVRIIGFGGAGLTQYQNAATFAATLGGSTRVEMQGYLHNKTTITFGQVVELNGTVVDGPEITEADSSGNGQMSGTLAFVLRPVAADGTVLAAIDGTLDYAGGGDPADAVQIRGGTPVGGHYAMALAGGGAARVSPATAPSPSVAECLTLP